MQACISVDARMTAVNHLVASDPLLPNREGILVSIEGLWVKCVHDHISSLGALKAQMGSSVLAGPAEILRYKSSCRLLSKVHVCVCVSTRDRKANITKG